MKRAHEMFERVLYPVLISSYIQPTTGSTLHLPIHVSSIDLKCSIYYGGLLYYGPEASELSCTNSCSIVSLSFGFLDQHWQRSSHILSSNPRLTTCSSLGRLGSSPCAFLKTTWIFFLISEYGISCVNNCTKFSIHL